MLEMHSKMPRFQNFSVDPIVTRAFSTLKSCLSCNFFLLRLLQSSCLLKTSLKTLEKVNIDVSGYEQAFHSWVL